MSERIKLVHSNIFFGGVEIKGDNPSQHIVDWLLLHYQKLIAHNPAIFKERLSVQESPVEKLIFHKPDILTLNEVMPHIDCTLDTLEKYHYNYVIGDGEHVPPPLTNSVVIASRSKIEKLPLHMSDDAGSGAVGAYISKHNALVFSAHPAAFNFLVRKRQLKELAAQVNNYAQESPDKTIIFTGDLNTEGVSGHFSHTSLNHYTAPTFPSDKIFGFLGERKWIPFRILTGHNRQRSIDHAFISSDKVVECTPFETNSDHKALLFNIS